MRDLFISIIAVVLLLACVEVNVNVPDNASGIRHDPQSTLESNRDTEKALPTPFHERERAPTSSGWNAVLFIGAIVVLTAVAWPKSRRLAYLVLDHVLRRLLGT